MIQENSQSNLEKDIDAIYDIEDRITDSEKKKEAAQQDVLTKENVFKMLLVFDKIFEKMNDADKRKLIESMIAEVHPQPNEKRLIPYKLALIKSGSITFLPVSYDFILWIRVFVCLVKW